MYAHIVLNIPPISSYVWSQSNISKSANVVNKLVVAVTKQTEVVDEDSTNTREMRQEISNLRVEISKINGKK